MTNNNPSRQEMINAIYDKIADKTLSFGCRIDLGIAEGVVYRTTQGGGVVDFFIGIQLKSAFTQELIKNSQIIGHPVMIGDVDKIIKKGPDYFNDWIKILDIWIKKDLPIEDQSDECIEFVYDLIK